MIERDPRIRPPADLDDDTLAKLKEAGFFESKAHALLFAASLGYALKDRRKLDAFGEGIKREYFDEESRAIDLIGVAGAGDLAVLTEERRRECAETFEEYAHAGLLKIKDVCYSGKRTPLEGLIKLLTEPVDAARQLPGLI